MRRSKKTEEQSIGTRGPSVGKGLVSSRAIEFVWREICPILDNTSTASRFQGNLRAEIPPGGTRASGMLSVSKWAVLLLSVLSLAAVGCGDDDKDGDKGGIGGIAGSDNGTAGTDEGTAGTDEGTAGTGGGDEYVANCTALCDNVYRCGGFRDVGPIEECYDVCEDGQINPSFMECFETTEACDKLSRCSMPCDDRATLTCIDEGGVCEDQDIAFWTCAYMNDCTDLETYLNGECAMEFCADEDAAWTSCIENDCEEYKACQE